MINLEPPSSLVTLLRLLCVELPFTTVRLGVAARAAVFSLLVTALAHGQGNVSVGTNIPPMTRGPGISKSPAPVAAQPTGEDPGLASALAGFNTAAKAKGEEVEIWKAISSHTKVGVKTLRQQQTATKMDYGNLLVANSLATSSGHTFAKILAGKTKAQSWSQLARDLGVAPATLTARLRAADASLKKPGARES